MTTMTVSALKDSGFYLVKEKVENAAELIEMLHYIDFLAQINAVDIGNLELPLEGDSFKLTKSDVTKLFFGHIENKKEEIKAAVVPIPANTLEDIKNSLVNTRDNMRHQQTRIIKQWRDDARFRYHDGDELLSQAVKKHRELNSITFDDPAEAIDKVVNGLPATNWDFHEYDSHDKTISFVSRSDVLLTHKIPEAGMSYELNCGKFRCEIHLENMRVKVVAHKGCVTDRDSSEPDVDEVNIHPNVNSDGSVCWGNAAGTFEECSMAGDILKVLQILDALLPNYGQPPYCDIETFQKDINNRDERLRKLREQQEKMPTTAEGPYGEQEFFADDTDDDQFVWADATEESGGANESINAIE